MSIRFKTYHQGYKIVSLAFNEQARDSLLADQLSVIYADESKGKIFLYPDLVLLSESESDIAAIKKYNCFDVFELLENGLLLRRYNDKSEDNYFFITGKCNSNCIICPSPECSRRSSANPDMNDLMQLAKHIPSDTPHLTITGGEPFLVGEQIFPFLQYLKNKFVNTEFLFLTNGRVFSMERYANLFCETVPRHTIVAIPIHGSCQEIHDRITRSDGSFQQTVLGIKRLLKRKIPVEIRIVINKINIPDFDNIAQLLIDSFQGIHYVSIIAMEMTGTARDHTDEIWIPYKESFLAISQSLRKLVENGIDVKLYNFPLCTVEPSFWVLCEKSISSSKVRFSDQCTECRYKASCSGVFAGTLPLERNELSPII